MDGDKEKQDTSVKDSSAQSQTSKETPEPFTKGTQAKAVSDALSTAGRTAKALEVREKAMGVREQRIKDTETKAAAKQTERDEAELEAAEGDKDERSRIKRRQELRTGELTLKQDREGFEREKVEQQAEIDAVKTTKLEVDVFKIATEQGVDASWLKDLGITDLGQLEKIAKGISTKEPTGPDPGGTKGGGKITEQQRLDNLYPTMKKS